MPTNKACIFSQRCLDKLSLVAWHPTNANVGCFNMISVIIEENGGDLFKLKGIDDLNFPEADRWDVMQTWGPHIPFEETLPGNIVLVKDPSLILVILNPERSSFGAVAPMKGYLTISRLLFDNLKDKDGNTSEMLFGYVDADITGHGL